MNELDAEIQAIAKITEVLSPLEPDAIDRVLRYVVQRYQAKVMPKSLLDSPTQASGATFSEFHELFDAAGPESASERALVAGYWFQQIQGKAELDGFLVNKELKNLGYPSNNITRDLDNLMKQTPRLITQIRKEGKSQQARKAYKLTSEGVRFVQNKLAANRASANIEFESNS